MHQKIVEMLDTDNKQIKSFVAAVLADCETATVEEVKSKYIANIRNYVVEGQYEVKMD